MKVEINLLDLIAIGAFLFFAFTSSLWWLTPVPVFIAVWFINPRRDNTGWRFLR